MIKSEFELLLPVGQKEMALAAIHNGADAIFVGMPGFNARGRSYDFEVAELKEIIEICHLYGVKVNLAFNIVIFEPELPVVVDTIKKILPLKPDALIIQDLGLARLVRQIAPGQVIHASTQMTVTNDLAIHLVDDLKIKRFVLGRENSISEIKLIKQRTEKELEVFVHGALCVSYSGQCFTSETLGGRSANRGQCAQSCRFSYDLIVDGEKKNLVDKEYLVSPQDLCGLAEIPALMDIGVSSFKVEGRLKTPDYVASVAQSFRLAMDRHLGKNDLSEVEITLQKKKMATNYSRGFFSGWLHGVDHQKLVNGTFSAHRGALVGQVIAIKKNAIVAQIQPGIHLENGDGLLWAQAGKKSEHGSFIFSIQKVAATTYEIGIANELSLNDSMIGSLLYLNHDKDLKKDLHKTYSDKNFFKKIPVDIEVLAGMNKPMIVKVSDGRNLVEMQTDLVVVPAQKLGMSETSLIEEFNSLAATVFSLRQLTYRKENFDENYFLPAKEIKILRQRIFEKLSEIRKNNTVDGFDSSLNTDFQLSLSNSIVGTALNSKVMLNVLLRDLDQVRDLCSAYADGALRSEYLDSVCLDFEFGRDYSEAINLLRSQSIKVGLATTRILKPQEYQNLKNLKSLNPDYILVRNLGAIEYYKNVNIFSGELRGDFSLNVTNHLSAEYLLSKGLSTVCMSYDVNASQALELLKSAQASKIEMTIHQAMPSFHMEHCVFAAFLSQGSSYRDCGKPCEKHKVQLKDQFGNLHWIKPDQECRNTMYNAKSQTAVSYINEWKTAGLGSVRYEALYERGHDLIDKIAAYLDLLEGKTTIAEALTKLKTYESYGLSAGNLSKETEYQSRKKSIHDLSK